MKNGFFLLFFVLFLASSCRNDEQEVQQIDQLLRLYIDSAGRDMLNSNITGTYRNIRLNDVYGITDTAPVSFLLKKDSDTLNYLEYIAGARRIGIDSAGTTKTYESRIALTFDRKVNDSTSFAVNDTMTIRYSWTPELFQISKIWYNNADVFTKGAGQPNIIKIKK